MIKNNLDVAKAAAEAYHQLTITGEIDVNGAKARAALLSVIQKSYMIDAIKYKLGLEMLPSEEASPNKGNGYVKRIQV